jgi:hypothetical protein
LLLQKAQSCLRLVVVIDQRIPAAIVALDPAWTLRSNRRRLRCCQGRERRRGVQQANGIFDLLGKLGREVQHGLSSRPRLAALPRRATLAIATWGAVTPSRPRRSITAVARSRPRLKRDNAASQAFHSFEDAIYDRGGSL